MSESSDAPRDLKKRTKDFALRIIRLFVALPKTTVARVIGNQVLRSGTSVGAHYWEAQRSRSNAELVSKIEGALQELEETRYWLELLTDANIVRAAKLENLKKEADELTAILVTAARTTRRRKEGKY